MTKHEKIEDDDFYPGFVYELGARIRTARNATGMTQEQLAPRAGLTRTSIANIEAGRFSTSSYHLFLIAQACNVSVADLFPPMV